MTVRSAQKANIIKDYGIKDADTGSADVQVAIITNRINTLAEHFKVHKKDKHSRRGLILMVSRRRRLLNYLARTDFGRYQALIQRLGLRK